MQNSDIGFHLTGANSDGDVQSEPLESLGNHRGSAISSTAMRNVWDHIRPVESRDGDTEHRCICVRNDHPIDTLSSANIWIQSNTSSTDTGVRIGLEQPSAQPQGHAQSVLNESTAPVGVTFVDTCVSEGTGLSIGDLEEGELYYVWIEREVDSGSRPLYDSYTLRVKGIDTFAKGIGYREHRVEPRQTPTVTFSKSDATTLRMRNTSDGDAYCLMVMPRDAIDGKTLTMTWDGEALEAAAHVEDDGYARIEVWDGEYDYTSDTDFVDISYPPDNSGQGILQTIVSKSTDFTEAGQDYSISLAQGDYDTVTLVIICSQKNADIDTTTVDIDKVEIYEGTTLISSYDFTDAVSNDRTGTYQDYGHMSITATVQNDLQSDYCVVDKDTPGTRMVLNNGLIRVRSRLESEDDSGCIDVWAREEVWDGSDASQNWIRMGRIRPYLSSFDPECPWSRIYINEIDLNRTVMRFWFNSSVYMDLTLKRGSRHIQMEWTSSLTGYIEFDIDDDQRSRFAYGRGEDIVDAELESSDGWNNLGVTNNWSIVFDDDHDFYIGLALADNAVQPRCYVDATDDVVDRIALGTGSALSQPHFIFFDRKVTEALYTYEEAFLKGDAAIVADANASLGYAVLTGAAAANDAMAWDIWNVCNAREYRLTYRHKSALGDPYAYSDVDGTFSYEYAPYVGRIKKWTTDTNEYYDYLVYIPEKCLNNIGISGPGDLAEESLCDWDYGIYITDDRNYEVKYTSGTVTNDWSIEPENIMILPDCVDTIDVTPTGYRAVNRDFSNASRNHATAGTPSNPANWTTNTAKADSLSGSCLESNTQSPSSIKWSISIPDTCYWVFVRLHAETGSSLGYEIRSDAVGTYHELKDTYYCVPDSQDTTASWQDWSYLEGYCRVKPGVTNVIRLNTYGVGAANTPADPRHVIDYIDIVPVDVLPVITANARTYQTYVYSGVSGLPLYDSAVGGKERYGQRMRPRNRDIERIGFLMSRTGAMAGVDGNVSLTARRVSDNSVIASAIYGLASTIPLTDTWIEASVTSTAIDEEVRICAEFSDGNGANFITVRCSNENPKHGEAMAQYPVAGSWQELINYDARYNFVFGSNIKLPDTITITPMGTSRINEDRWRSHFHSENIRGRSRFKHMDVGGGLDMNQKYLIAPVLENLSAAPISPVVGQPYFDISGSKFYGWTGSTWVEL